MPLISEMFLKVDKSTDPTSKITLSKTFSSSSFTKTLLIFAIYFFYLLSGLFNEKLTTTNYTNPNDETKTFKFKYPTISLCILSLFTTIISSYMLEKKNPKSYSPITSSDKIILGTIHTISQFTSQLTLLYLDYIIKTICKSLKSAAMMFIFFLNTIPFCNKILQKILNNSSNKNNSNIIHFKDIIKVCITTISVILFNLSSSNKKYNSSNNSIIGIVILIISLFSDGLLSLKEKIIQININQEYKEYENVISWVYMKIFGIGTFLFCFIQIIFRCIFGNYIQVLKIIFSNSKIIYDLITYVICESFGQSVVFIFLGKYGPLALSMISSTRKIMSISLSIFYFGKSISIMQAISLLLAVWIILWEIFDKGRKIKKEDKIKKIG